MEISKTTIEKENIIKITIGATMDEDSQQVSGNVELDIENQGSFVEIINTVIEEESYDIFIDLQFISYIDSSGLWALFEGHKKATQRNKQFLLINPTKDVQRVLNITKLSEKMNIFDEEAAALSAVKAPNNEVIQ